MAAGGGGGGVNLVLYVLESNLQVMAKVLVTLRPVARLVCFWYSSATS